MLLTTCCGCCSLKAGTISIGVLGIVGAVISLFAIFTSDGAWKKTWVSEDIDAEDIDNTTIKVIYAVSNCIAILISTLLILGASKKITCMMLPWLIVNMIGIIGASVNILYSTIISLINSEVLLGILVLLFGLIIIIIFTYLWLVVYYYLKQIRIEKIEKMNNKMDKEPHNLPQV